MLKPAQIVYQDGNCVMDCVVADLSEGVRDSSTQTYSLALIHSNYE